MIKNTRSTLARTRPQTVVIIALATVILALLAGPLASAKPSAKQDYVRHVDSSTSNPMIATGVTLNPEAKVYKSSGLGPSALNPAATRGTPESYVDVDQFPGGTLSNGVTITEAQGINVLRQIEKNLGERGLSVNDVTTMRVFLDNAPGMTRADYDGWNRAYRQ